MDCQVAKEQISLYIDGVLSRAEGELLLAHVATCPACTKELDDMIYLQQALSSLHEVDPPEGLAAAALRKARRHRGMPIAYISVGVAAVLAFVLILTGGILPQLGISDQSVPESYMLAAPKEIADSGAGSNEVEGAAEAPESMTRQATADEMPQDELMFSAATEAMPEESATPSGEASIQDSEMIAMMQQAPACIVYVTSDRQTSVRAVLESIITEYDIELTFLSDEAVDTFSFVLPEVAMEEITALVADLTPEGEITVDAPIEFRFVK